MKIAFTTVDLYKGREFLMPWRTVIEIVKGMRENGLYADVVNLPVSSSFDENTDSYNSLNIQGLLIKKAPRDFGLFCRFIEKEGYDVVIYPTPWREALKKDFKAFASLKCRKIAYFPGGVYDWTNNLSLLKYGGWNVAKPYVIDTLTPYKKFVGLMKQCGFEAVVGLSPYTTETVKKAGFAKSICILPGKDDFDQLPDSLDVFKRIGLKPDEKYLLFTGAPAPTRGAQVLAKACDRLAERCEKDGSEIPNVIFLMRRDVGSDFSMFLSSYDKIKDKGHFKLILDKVSRNELKTLMAYSHGVILPFLVIPSEIPITYFEVLSLGIPIVTFHNGGTTDYLKDALLVCKSGDVYGLMNNIMKIWNDDDVHRQLSKNAKRIMEQHHTWDEVTSQWIDLVNK